MTIKDVLDYVVNMLSSPAPDAHTSTEAERLFEDDRDAFIQKAREETASFAK